MSTASFLRHGTAVAATGLALALWVLGRSHVEPSPYLFFVAAVVISACYGGLAQGMLASGLTAAAALVLYLHVGSPTGYSDLEHRMQFVLFVLIALLVAALTARLRSAQLSLQHQLAFSHALSMNLGEGLLAIDAAGQITFANTAAQHLLGWSADELTGNDVYTIVAEQRADEEKVERESSSLLSVLRSGSTTHVDSTFFARRGSSAFPVSYTISPIVADHRITGAVIAFRDTAERQQVETALRESEDRYRTVVETSPDCIWLTDGYGYVMMANHRAAELFAYGDPEEMRDMKALDLFAQHDRARAIQDRGATLDVSSIRNAQYQCLRADGSTFPAEVSTSAILDEDGKLESVVYVARDISDRREAEAAVRASESRLAMQYAATTALAKYASFEHACPKLLQTICTDSGWDVGAYWEVSKNGKSLECRYIWRAPGVSTDGIEGLNLETSFARGIGLPGRVWETAETVWLADVLADTSAHQGITTSRDKVHAVLTVPVLASGSVYGVLQFFSRHVRPEDSQLIQSIMAVATQCGQHVERAETERQLAQQALHDSVTGLPGRTLYLDRLQQALHSGHRNNTPVALLVADLDGLRNVNESFSTDAGNMVLQQVASRLREQLRQNDTVARIGDDEFAIVLPGTDRNGAVQAAEKVLRALRLPYHVGGQDIDLGTTMGIAVYPEHGGNADTITRRGDVAMHVAKRTRRDWAEFSPEQEDSQLNRLVLTRELRTALENNELVLHYLPKVSLKTGRIEGVEALVRWHHPERGLIEPDEFISLAENTGVIPLLTMQVMSMALRQWRAWHDMGTDLRISVNLSPRLLLDSQLISTVSGLLETWGVDPSWLEVELPESALSGDPERALGMLSRLKEKGLRITIDDFGTGSSSLPLLRRLPVSEIKIDRSFVSRMLDNPDDGVIVRSIVDLGHNLGYQVLAEGVEGRQAFDMLTEMGCDLAQGTYLSEPLTALDLIRRYGGSAPSTSSVAL